MARTLQDMLLASRIGASIGDPIGAGIGTGMIREQQEQDRAQRRQEELADTDAANKLKIGMLLAQNPELAAATKSTPTEQVQGLGTVGLPSALSGEQQTALDKTGQSPIAGDRIPLGNTGMAVSPSQYRNFMADYEAKKRAQDLEEYQNKKQIEQTGMTEQENLKARNRMAELDKEISSKEGIEKEKLQAEKDMLEKRLSTDSTSKMGMKMGEDRQKRWDKLVKQANPLTASPRTPLGAATIADYRANRAIDTLANPMVTNQEAGNVMADIASIYQGGSPTQFGMSEQQYSTIYGKLQGVLQSITGKPQDALTKGVKDRLMGVLNDMKKTNKAVIKQNFDFLEKSQPELISHFQDEWQGIREEVEGGVKRGESESASPKNKATGQAIKIGKYTVTVE